MSVECCGKPRTTPFCPQCGKGLDVHTGLGDLLAHCRSTEKRIRADARRFRWNFKEVGNSRYSELARRSDEMADKWKTWAEALAELMAKQEK